MQDQGFSEFLERVVGVSFIFLNLLKIVGDFFAEGCHYVFGCILVFLDTVDVGLDFCLRSLL
jgi:hypothetical protein